MNLRPLPLVIASLIAILVALPYAAAPQIEGPPLMGESPGDSPGEWDPADDYCALSGLACIGGIVGDVPACGALCPTVLGCIACGGIVSGTIMGCLNYSDKCISTNAHEGDLCRLGNRCETGGLHCVDNHCTANRGAEGQRCSTDRDCQVGVPCLPDGVGLDGGKCWRPRASGELCSASAECQTGLICDPSNHSCRTPGCGEVIGRPINTQDCPCTIDQAHPGPQGDCLNGFRCDGGQCTQVIVTICACDGSDAPGTCTSCAPTPGGGGPPLSGYFYQPTCYYFYDIQTYYTCATYGEQTECGDEQTEYMLTDRFCV